MKILFIIWSIVFVSACGTQVDSRDSVDRGVDYGITKTLTVSDYTAPVDLSFSQIGVCGKGEWAASPEQGALAEWDLKFWHCTEASEEGPYLDLQVVKLPIKKICGCDPLDFSLEKVAAGEYKARFRLDSGTWYLALSVGKDDSLETVKIEADIP